MQYFLTVKFNPRFIATLLASGLFLCVYGLADDSAASIAAGGLVSRRETRIAMTREVLRLSPDKVIVDYDFRNESDEDVTTVVAFPVPAYTNHFPEWQGLPQQAFQSFQAWANGKPVTCKTEARATLKGKDVTGLLRSHGIDIPTLGQFDESTGAPVTRDFGRLPVILRKELIREGVFEIRGGDPPEKNTTGVGVFARWSVHLKYYWTQTFPAHSTVHIRHEYQPVVGFTQITSSSVEDLLSQVSTGRHTKDDSGGVKLLQGFCADKPFLSAISRSFQQAASTAKTEDDMDEAGIVYPSWVDFILTSANTWKRPIGDFTLIVKRGRSEIENRRRLVSFCSPNNAQPERLDADRFRVHLTNFVPTSELHIGFFDVAQAPTASQRRSPE